MMDETLFHFLGARVTCWKLVGYGGVLMFSLWWFV